MVKNTLTPICEEKKKTRRNKRKFRLLILHVDLEYFWRNISILVDYCTEWYMQNDPEHLLELSNGKKKLPLIDKKDILTEMYLWCRY